MAFDAAVKTATSIVQSPTATTKFFHNLRLQQKVILSK
jgi:hypothetical protein